MVCSQTIPRVFLVSPSYTYTLQPSKQFSLPYSNPVFPSFGCVQFHHLCWCCFHPLALSSQLLIPLLFCRFHRIFVNVCYPLWVLNISLRYLYNNCKCARWFHTFIAKNLIHKAPKFYPFQIFFFLNLRQAWGHWHPEFFQGIASLKNCSLGKTLQWKNELQEAPSNWKSKDSQLDSSDVSIYDVDHTISTNSPFLVLNLPPFVTQWVSKSIISSLLHSSYGE